MALELDGDSFGSAALSVAAAIVFKLIDAKIMSKQEALDLYEQIAVAKSAKGKAYRSPAEEGASILAQTMRAEIEARY